MVTMGCLQDFTGEYVTVELSGNKCIDGHLVDSGLDILVVGRHDNYYYIPLVHIQNISFDTYTAGDDGAGPDEGTSAHPFKTDAQINSFRKVLLAGRGHFMEMYVSGNTTIHGYITSVMNDYFVFHSPVYKTIFVSLSHLKWLMPYAEDVTPYALDPESIPHRSVPTSLPRTFKEQCKKLIGNLVVFDMGDNPNKIGQLKSVDDDHNMLELYTANGAERLLH